jgi:hypothetical protein
MRNRDIDITGKQLKHANRHFVSVSETSPEKGLALAILNRAKEDADNGDFTALAFLLHHGLKLEELILGDSYFDQRDAKHFSPTLAFCEKCFDKINNDGYYFKSDDFNRELRLLRSEIRKERKAIQEHVKLLKEAAKPQQMKFTAGNDCN